jgi:uncharacterized CHY-type Zn-finger protein
MCFTTALTQCQQIQQHVEHNTNHENLQNNGLFWQIFQNCTRKSQKSRLAQNYIFWNRLHFFQQHKIFLSRSSAIPENSVSSKNIVACTAVAMHWPQHGRIYRGVSGQMFGKHILVAKYLEELDYNKGTAAFLCGPCRHIMSRTDWSNVFICETVASRQWRERLTLKNLHS